MSRQTNAVKVSYIRLYHSARMVFGNAITKWQDPTNPDSTRWKITLEDMTDIVWLGIVPNDCHGSDPDTTFTEIKIVAKTREALDRTIKVIYAKDDALCFPGLRSDDADDAGADKRTDPPDESWDAMHPNFRG